MKIIANTVKLMQEKSDELWEMPMNSLCQRVVDFGDTESFSYFAAKYALMSADVLSADIESHDGTYGTLKNHIIADFMERTCQNVHVTMTSLFTHWERLDDGTEKSFALAAPL